MPCRLVKPYNGQAANTIFWGSQSDESPLLATGNADDLVELASDYVVFERTFTGATVNTSRYATRYKMNSATAQSFVVNPSGYWPVGTVLKVFQVGAGKTTISATGNATVTGPNGLVTQVPGETTLLKTGPTTWLATGNLGAT